MSTLFLCGSTNSEGVRLARNVQRATGRWDRLVLLDDDAKRWGKEVVEVPVVGGFAELAHAQPGDEAINLVTRTTRGRAKAAERIAGFGVPMASLVAADVDTLGVDLAEGVTIYPQAMVCAGASVGGGSVVLMRAVVGHGAKVAEGCVVASTGTQLGDCLDHLPEVNGALAGQYTAVGRPRMSDEPPPPLHSISRRGQVRLFTATPLFEDGQVVGVVRMSRTAIDPLEALWQHRQTLLYALVGSLLLVGAVSLFFARRITRPVRAITEGDGFTIRAGCDKRIETCGAKFANTASFRGFPHIPGQDAVLRYATKDGGHEGSVL